MIQYSEWSEESDFAMKQIDSAHRTLRHTRTAVSLDLVGLALSWELQTTHV